MASESQEIDALFLAHAASASLESHEQGLREDVAQEQEVTRISLFLGVLDETEPALSARLSAAAASVASFNPSTCVLVGLCNPLLDISSLVPASMLEKYNVRAGNAILAEPEHLPVYADLVANFAVDYIAG